MPKSLDTNSPVNPDRTQFQIIRRTPNAPEAVTVGNKEYKMGKAGMMIHDRGVANEIFQQHHGKDLLVAPIEKPIEAGTRRTFTVRLPKNYKRESDAN
jgi:hypothetical protein